MHPIKFFIHMNGEEIKNIDDLRKNFNPNDALRLYQEGVLKRWWHTHYGDDDAKKLDDIDNESNSSILQGLWRVISPNLDIREIDNAVHYFDFLDQHFNQLNKFREINKRADDVIANYHNEYENIKSGMLENSHDMLFCRAAIKEIGRRHLKLFALDYNAVTKLFLEQAPSNILLLFSNQPIRAWLEESNYLKALANLAADKMTGSLQKYIPIPYGTYSTDSAIVEDNKEIKTLIKLSDKYTHESWDDIEPDKDKQFMILHIPNSCRVREIGTRKDITDEAQAFPIISGIEYNSKKAATSQLIYMEV